MKNKASALLLVLVTLPWLAPKVGISSASHGAASVLFLGSGVIIYYMLLQSLVGQLRQATSECLTENRVCLGLTRATLLLVLTAKLASILYTNSLAPVSAWDVLSFWAPASIAVGGEGVAFEGVNSLNTHRHGAMMAWFVYFASEASYLSMGILTPGFFYFLPLAVLIIIILEDEKSRNTKPLKALIVISVILSLPLFENLLSLWGYTANFQAMLIACAILLLAFGCQVTKLQTLFISALLILASSGLRNSAYIISLVTLASIGFSLAHYKVQSTGYSFIGIVILLFTFLFGVLYRGVDTVIIGERLYFDWESRSVSIAGIGFVFEQREISELASVLLTSFIKNSSFSLIGLTFLVCWWGKEAPNSCNKSHRYNINIIICSYFLVFVSALHLDYFYRVSLPGSDTGFSRVVIIISIFMALSLAQGCPKKLTHEPSCDE